jgi:hypothetical protein
MSAPATPIRDAIDDVLKELQRQVDLDLGGDTTQSFDETNTQNDWVAYISAYSGRAAAKCFRNAREECDFRENMVKTAALAVAAIRAHDKGYC